MASSPHSAGLSTVTLSVSQACAQPVSVHRHSQLRGAERVPASLLRVTRQVARRGGTQSWATWLQSLGSPPRPCLPLSRVTPLKLTPQVHDA